MKIYPALRYRDARAAIDWLGEAFGFTEKAVHAGEGDAIAHAELNLPGGGLVMLSSEPEEPDRWGKRAGLGWLYAATDDVDALHDRAVAAGAEVVMELPTPTTARATSPCAIPRATSGASGRTRRDFMSAEPGSGDS